MGEYIFDSVTRILTINVGNLASQEVKVIRIVTRLNSTQPEITNSVTASDILNPGVEPIVTASVQIPIIAG